MMRENRGRRSTVQRQVPSILGASIAGVRDLRMVSSRAWRFQHQNLLMLYLILSLSSHIYVYP